MALPKAKPMEESKWEIIADLSIACIGQIQCDICDTTLDTDTLYYCNHVVCGNKIYCSECGEWRHNPDRKNYHEFLKQEINELLEKKENSAEYKHGRKQLIKLIGLAKYHKIEKYFNYATSLVGSSLNQSSAVAFVNEVQLMLQAADKVVKATRTAKQCVEMSNKLLMLNNEMSKLNFETVTAMKQLAIKQEALQAQLDAANVNAGYFDWVKNKAIDIKDWWNGDCTPCVQLEEATNARNVAQLKVDNLLKDTEAAQKFLDGAKNVKVQTVDSAVNAMKSVKESMVNSAKISLVLVSITTAGEMAYHASRYYRSEICGMEFVRLSGKALCRNVASAGGSTVGGGIGVYTGIKLGALGVAYGTGIGLGVGIIGGMLLGYYAGKKAEDIFEKYWPSKDEMAKKTLLREALLYFRFEKEDIENPIIFNEKALKKEFKLAALKAHPDRNVGSHEKWHKLSIYYGVLQSLLEQNEENKKIVQETLKPQIIED